MPIPVIAGIAVLVVVLIVVGLRQPRSQGTIQDRLMEYSAREEPISLEELELSQPFSERILVPMIEASAQFITRFTPQQTLEQTRHKLELAGRPNNWSPAEFWGVRVVATALLGGLLFLLMTVSQQPFGKRLMFGGGAALVGFIYPQIWLNSRIRSRQNAIIRALPDALDLLTICVEAGLGFDAALSKVNEKWDDPLSQEFGRVIRDIQLGKGRTDALRDMANRMDVSDVTSFVAAIVQTEQLGVSIAKVLKIQSEQMRMKRRQRAEERAHQAPIKMLFPMVFLIFPSIYIVLLGPAVLQVMNSGAFGGGGLGGG
jgi:tight adherence protein C